jgi:hypothetical protein
MLNNYFQMFHFDLGEKLGGNGIPDIKLGGNGIPDIKLRPESRHIRLCERPGRKYVIHPPIIFDAPPGPVLIE